MAGGGVAFSQALGGQGLEGTNPSEPVVKYGTGGRITGFADGGHIRYPGIRHFDVGGDTSLGFMSNADYGADFDSDFGGGFGGSGSDSSRFTPPDDGIPEFETVSDRPVGEITPFDFGPIDDILIPVDYVDDNVPEVIIPADRPSGPEPVDITPFDFGPIDNILIPVDYVDDNVPEMIIPAPRPPGPEPVDITPIPYVPIPLPTWEFDPEPEDDNVPEMIIPAPRPPGPEPEDIIPIPFVPIPEPTWEFDPEPEPGPGPEPGPIPDPEPGPGPIPEPEVPVPEPEAPVPVPDPIWEPEPEPGPIPDPEPEPEPGPAPYVPMPVPVPYVPVPVPYVPVPRATFDPAPAPYVPTPGIAPARQGIYRPQYQNYANPLTMFNVSNYGQDVPTSPGYNYASTHQGIDALNQNLRAMADRQMAQTYPDGSPRGADMNAVLAEMRRTGVTATDLENAYYGRTTGLNTPFSVYSKTPPMQTPFSFTDVQQSQNVQAPQTVQQRQQAMSNGIFDLIKKLPK